MSTIASPITLQLHTVRSEEWCINKQKNVIFNRTLQFRPLCTHFQQPSEKKLSITTHGSKKKRSSLICYSGAEQTATVTKQSPTSTITNAPIKSTDLLDVGGDGGFPPHEFDDGDGGFPPRDDGNGGGGGGGWSSGGWSSGGFGFFLFSSLAFMDFLKDKETEESPYESRRRR